MALYCAVCLYAVEGTAEKADTIINGTAVCEAHMGYVRGGYDVLHDAIRHLKP